jgi:hypothetical protein
LERAVIRKELPECFGKCQFYIIQRNVQYAERRGVKGTGMGSGICQVSNNGIEIFHMTTRNLRFGEYRDE